MIPLLLLILLNGVSGFVGGFGHFGGISLSASSDKFEALRRGRGFFSTLDSGPSEGVDIAEEEDDRVITFRPNALLRLKDLVEKKEGETVLRMGVRSGGCSGLR